MAPRRGPTRQPAIQYELPAYGNAAAAEQIPPAGEFVEPAWSRGLGRGAEVDAASAQVAREDGLCQADASDAACLEGLDATPDGRRLLATRDSLSRLTRTREAGIRTGTPQSERVWGSDMHHTDVGDGGAHVHLLDTPEQHMGEIDARGPTASIHVGQLNERTSADQSQQFGIRAGGSLADIGASDDAHDDRIAAHGPRAGVEASAGEDGIVLEAGASAADIDGAVRFEDAADLRLEGGVAAGAGVGFRIPYGDTDGDGVREIGGRATLGPVTVQATSEAPHRIYRWLAGEEEE